MNFLPQCIQKLLYYYRETHAYITETNGNKTSPPRHFTGCNNHISIAPYITLQRGFFYVPMCHSLTRLLKKQLCPGQASLAVQWLNKCNYHRVSYRCSRWYQFVTGTRLLSLQNSREVHKLRPIMRVKQHTHMRQTDTAYHTRNGTHSV